MSLDLFILATYCNVVFNADADNLNAGLSAIGLDNEQEEGIGHQFFLENRSQTDCRR
jgi:hypothetical protein